MPDIQSDTQNEALLKRIRQRYRYGMDKWDRNRKEGQKNIRYVSGDPWDEEDKQARKGRPTVCPDELNQYVNQVVNTARQNPRGIKIDPAGGPATEQLAEYRENRIRAIEYACNASQVYTNGLQGAVERNVGYWKVSRGYVSDDSDEQEILILPVMNPDAVLIDPDFKELDGSDIRWAFELDRLPLEDFEAEYPDAEKTSFSADDFGGDESYWYDGKSILIASYWEVKTEQKKVGKKNRTVNARTIQQYVTNGAEILKKGATQPGPYIPIVPVLGKELWVDYGGGAERVLLSLVSLARDPQKALAYVMSSMLEHIGQLPKTTVIGYVGQFETDADTWNTINSIFHPYAQVNAVTDESGNLLPLPNRLNSSPDFQSYSIGADICRRAIMSAMGIGVQPTAMQRANQKSGVAMEKIQSQQAIGSYHLVDAYDRAIQLTGRIVNHWLAETDLGETKRPVRLADGKHKLVEINTDAPVVADGHTYHFPIADDQGRYQVTVSSGPSHESQREEGSEFVDTVIQNLHNLPLAPQQAAEILALGIRLKQLGPLGDQMADIISPQNAAMAGQLSQLQQQVPMMQEQMQKMAAQLQQLQLEKQAKVIDRQGQLEVEKLKASTELAVAEMNASKDVNEAFAKAEIEKYKLMHESAHEVALQAHEHAHEQVMSAQEHAQAQEIAEQQAANQRQVEATPGVSSDA